MAPTGSGVGHGRAIKNGAKVYLIKPITKKCKNVFSDQVPPEMRRGRDLLVEFQLVHEVIQALRRAGLVKDRDFEID